MKTLQIKTMRNQNVQQQSNLPPVRRELTNHKDAETFEV